VRIGKVTPTGSELPTRFPKKTAVLRRGGAKYGANRGSSEFEAQNALGVAADWDALGPDDRAFVLALARSTS
jgi:hypothetical protein